MSGKKRDDLELWRVLQEQEIQDDIEEIMSMSDEELDRFIDENGGDSKAIRASGASLAKELSERNEKLARHRETNGMMDTVHTGAKGEARVGAPKLSRKELIARLEIARVDPRFKGERASIMFHKKSPEACTDEELEMLLESLELLAMLQEE
jgi:hypothetical protein